MKKVMLFDIDQTIYDGVLFLDLCKFYFDNKIIKKDTLNKVRREVRHYTKHKLSYEEATIKALKYLAVGLTGMEYLSVLNVTKEYVANEFDKFYPFFTSIVAEYQDDYDYFIVTSEPSFVAKVLVEHYALRGFFSTEFEIKDGIFTGKIQEMLVSPEDKNSALDFIFERFDRTASVGIGDSMADADFLKRVKIPIAINPDKELKKIALAEKIPILKSEEIEEYLKTKI